MKYQGFYDYALGDDGKPDRTFTAQQFCRHLSAIFGNGIVITNATGNDAWKVEKITNEDLKIKIKLGSNNFNFASLRGNPFAVDEEINIELSQGTDRWDAIMIRADATSTVRATDIKVTENNIALTRTDTIYDLRLARVHIVNNVITEIIDDRLNNDYCGIAAGLATINADDILNSIKNELESIESGELVALKNGLLQTGLNSEKLGGKTSEEIIAKIKLISKYSNPTISYDNQKNNLFLDLPLDSYEEKLVVKICVEPTSFKTFASAIFPTTFSASNLVINGFTVSSGDRSAFNTGNATSKNGKAYDSTDNSASIGCPVAIKPQTITLNHASDSTAGEGKITFYGSKDNENWEKLIEEVVSVSSSPISYQLTYNGDKKFNYFKINMYHSRGRTSGNVISNFNIIAGEESLFNNFNDSNLKIGGLEVKNIDGIIQPYVKYQLCFEDNKFVILRGE